MGLGENGNSSQINHLLSGLILCWSVYKVPTHLRFPFKVDMHHCPWLSLLKLFDKNYSSWLLLLSTYTHLAVNCFEKQTNKQSSNFAQSRGILPELCQIIPWLVKIWTRILLKQYLFIDVLKTNSHLADSINVDRLIRNLISSLYVCFCKQVIVMV